MRSIESKHGLTYIMGLEIHLVCTKRIWNIIQKQIRRKSNLLLRNLRRDIIKLVKLKDGNSVQTDEKKLKKTRNNYRNL